ncbi:hypothetical protein FKM82_011521 [Ascaphus truei]
MKLMACVPGMSENIYIPPPPVFERLKTLQKVLHINRFNSTTLRPYIQYSLKNHSPEVHPQASYSLLQIIPKAWNGDHCAHRTAHRSMCSFTFPDPKINF